MAGKPVSEPELSRPGIRLAHPLSEHCKRQAPGWEPQFLLAWGSAASTPKTKPESGRVGQGTESKTVASIHLEPKAID